MNNLLKNSLVVFLGCLLLGGCAAPTAFQAGEREMAEGQYDKAIGLFAQAVKEHPQSHEYRMKLNLAKLQSAKAHLNAGRQFMRENDFRAAAREFRYAALLDPSVVAASQELNKVQDWLKAEDLVKEAEVFYEQRRYSQSKNLLERVLRLQPENQRARDLLDTIVQEQLVLLDGHELALASTAPITLKFQEVALRDAFAILSRLSGINFIFDEGVAENRMTLFLEEATFSQALNILLKMNDLGKRVLNPKTIIVFPRTEQKLQQYEDQIIQVFYLSNIDSAKAVNMLRSMLQLRKIFVHEELNALVIRDQPEVIKLAGQILEAADRGDSEVVFDLELVEVSHADTLDLGPRLSTYSISAGFGNDTNIVLDTLLPGVPTTNLVDSFSSLESFYTLPSATFDFAKTLSDSEILANPKIRVKNKEKAKIHIGTREPIATTSTSGDIVSTNVQYVDVGVKLDIEPVIQLDDSVITILNLEVSNVSDRTLIPESGTTLLTITTTNAASSLILKDGERTIIGGLIRDDYNNTKSTFPFIGHIPIIGDLLSNRSRQNTKREILLSITPHVVRKMELPRPEISTIWSGGETDPVAGNRFASFEAFKPDYEQQPLDAAPARLKAPESASVLSDDAGRIALQAPPVVLAGEPFTVTVMAEMSGDLHSAPFTLNFPPGQLEVIAIDEGNLLGREGVRTVFTSSVDREEGKIVINHSRRPGASGVSGAGSLARVTLRAKSAGSVPIEFFSGIFQNKAGNEIPVPPTVTTIEVQPNDETRDSQ